MPPMDPEAIGGILPCLTMAYKHDRMPPFCKTAIHESLEKATMFAPVAKCRRSLTDNHTDRQLWFECWRGTVQRYHTPCVVTDVDGRQMQSSSDAEETCACRIWKLIWLVDNGLPLQVWAFMHTWEHDNPPRTFRGHRPLQKCGKLRASGVTSPW